MHSSQDVKDPPPALFLSDLDAYIARTHSAGALVLLHFLKYVGFVTSAWMWAGRSGGGPVVRKLTCYSFHMFRSVAHKIASVQIALITLFGYCCAFPKLQVHIMNSCTFPMMLYMSSTWLVSAAACSLLCAHVAGVTADSLLRLDVGHPRVQHVD